MYRDGVKSNLSLKLRSSKSSKNKASESFSPSKDSESKLKTSSSEREKTVTPVAPVQAFNLRQMKLITEAPIVIMPLDWSSHSTYCMTFYIKYIHKQENKVHVCYVAEDLRRRSEESSNDLIYNITKRPKEEQKGCLAAVKRCIMPMTSIMDTMGPSPGMINELERQDRANYNLVKSEVKDFFTSNEIQHWDFKRLIGEEPWKAILDYREELGGTLIVLGSRGLGAFKRNIFGSVSEKVLRKSSVPVLVVRCPSGALSATTNVVTGVSTIF